MLRSRMREERGETERALALDTKPKDLSSNHGNIYCIQY